MTGNKVSKKDFVEIEFVGKNLSNGEIFDTNIKEEAKKINLEINPKPLIVCAGQGMLVKGFDESLENQEIGQIYTIKLSPDKAFGKRNSQMVRLIPMKMFAEQKIYPQPGMTFALDNNLVKIVSVSGGRVMVDFNNPLAGKDVEFTYTIKRKVADAKEKINAIQTFFFGREFEFTIDSEKNKIIFSELKLMPVLNAFKDKFKDLLGMDVEILAKPEKKDEKVEEKK
jgi:FKBP-type peptidyl-prolyl cis-trans isomerase 2